MSTALQTTDQKTLNLGRFSSIMSTALTMTAAGAHLMELPAKMRYEPSLYVRLHRTLYWNFGRASGSAEAVAVVATNALAWWTRRHQPQVFRYTATAAACLTAAHAIFWGVVQPVNGPMAARRDSSRLEGLAEPMGIRPRGARGSGGRRPCRLDRIGFEGRSAGRRVIPKPVCRKRASSNDNRTGRRQHLT